MLDRLKNINFIENDQYFSSIVKGLGVEGEKINIFLDRFNKFFEEDKEENITLPRFIIKVRSFMRRYRKEIQDIFFGTILSNYDCLTQCILAGYISENYGHKLNLARPQEIHRYFHALLVDRDKGKYKMAGKRKVGNYEVIDMQEAIRQLQITHPVISTGKRIHSSIIHLLQINPS